MKHFDSTKQRKVSRGFRRESWKAWRKNRGGEKGIDRGLIELFGNSLRQVCHQEILNRKIASQSEFPLTFETKKSPH